MESIPLFRKIELKQLKLTDQTSNGLFVDAIVPNSFPAFI